MSLFSELKRRNVFRVATAYVIVGWLLTEILATLFPMFGVPDWVVKAVVIVVAMGFVPLLVFSWAFELTPEGLKREKDVDRDSSITSATGKKLDYVTIVAVVLGVAFIGWSKTGTDEPAPAYEIVETSGAPSVAVLPFVNMSGNTENEYFSDGLTETLLHMLAQIPGLKVAARTSSFAFKGKEQDIRVIAHALNVAHVLEGSVQRAGDRVRVTAQLIRADDGFHVWSSNYDRVLNDIFAIQDEIAADVGKSLSTSLLGESDVEIESVGTEDVAAYDLYLQALSDQATGSYGSLREAEGLLKDALLVDANFLDAKIALVDVYIWQADTGMRDYSAAFTDGIVLLEQVLAARPNDLIAKEKLLLLTAYSAEAAGSVTALQDALPQMRAIVSAAPNNAQLRKAHAYLLFDAGRRVDGLAEMQKALEYDPLNASIHYDIGIVHRVLHDWDLAQAAYDRSLELKPNQPNVYNEISRLKEATGDGVGVLSNWYMAMESDSQDHEIPSAMAGYLYNFGLIEEGDPFRDRAMLIAPNSPATRHANLRRALASGDQKKSLELARSMIEDDIRDRHFAYFEAVGTVLYDAVQNGMAADALEYMELHQPGFNDVESTTIKLKVRAAQSVAFAAWAATMPAEEFGNRIDAYWRVVELGGVTPEDNPLTYLEVLAVRRETESAIEFGLAHVFNVPITEAIWWRDYIHLPHLQSVLADPRVQEQVQRWEIEKSETREQLRVFLAERSK